uniref:Protein TIFY n=1 Tax=Leersia perrieri TaxID=77586 RepID=A0A0D9XJA5_9ORYZ
MAAADCAGRRRFAVACGVLSRCVKAEAAAAAAAGNNIVSPPAASTMLLMPGADVAPDVVTEEEQAAAQLTIMYGGRVVVFDGFPAESVAELVRAAARKEEEEDDVARRVAADLLLPVARKGSLQRFMEKRRGRLAATAPYSARAPSPPAGKAGKEDGDPGCWLVLGTPGSGAAGR